MRRINTYGKGVRRFLVELREGLGPDRLMLADGHHGRHDGVSGDSTTPIGGPDQGQLTGQADHAPAPLQIRCAGGGSGQREEQPRQGSGEAAPVDIK